MVEISNDNRTSSPKTPVYLNKSKQEHELEEKENHLKTCCVYVAFVPNGINVFSFQDSNLLDNSDTFLHWKHLVVRYL